MAIRLISAIFAQANSTHSIDTASSIGQKRSRLRLLLAAGCLGFVVASSTGCTMLDGACRAIKKNECLDDLMIGHRNRALAAKAWHRQKHLFSNCHDIRELRAGFFAGYADIANGGKGCLPAVAPSHYWGWRYQTPGGQARVNSWFAGFPMGAKAAEEDGVGGWGEIIPVGMQQARAQSQTFLPEPVVEESTVPYYEELERYPHEPVPADPNAGAFVDPVDDQPMLPEIIAPEVVEPIERLDAPAPVEAPAPIEAPAAPVEAPADPFQDSTSLGRLPSPVVISDEFTPQRDFLTSEDLVPREPVGESPSDQVLDDGAVRQRFEDTPVSTSVTDEGSDLPYTFE
jgi:hypothetical protein